MSCAKPCLRRASSPVLWRYEFGHTFRWIKGAPCVDVYEGNYSDGRLVLLVRSGVLPQCTNHAAFVEGIPVVPLTWSEDVFSRVVRAWGAQR